MRHQKGAFRVTLVALWVLTVTRLTLAEDVPSHAGAAFAGKITLSANNSIPAWPQRTRAPKDAPNILLILLDDIGFADTSTFGGIAQTPELDRLASQGLRYNNFNTASMCSSTRAALLTGRNHHRVGFGSIADFAGGYPGYNSIWKKSTASIAEVLREHGYSTAAFGKWHNTPDWEITPAGPFDHWPTGLGFEYFYGFMGPAGQENQWEPSRLYRDTIPVEPPATPQQGYHFTTDITNEAIRWLKTHKVLAPNDPFFLYFATGAVHAPHQAPKVWIDQYRGKFDQGWDTLNAEIFARQKVLGVIPANAKLTPRPKEIPAWDSLSADQKRLYARQMEVYAGFVAQTDYEVGRLLRAVQSAPGADNTLILYIVGDNGSCAMGGLNGYTDFATTVAAQLLYIDELGSPLHADNIYAAGWAWAGSTPFQWMKSIASHFGGVRDPLIVVWPGHIRDRGSLRSQFTHVNDVAATLYDVIGISPPPIVDGVKQQPLDGMSFAQTFASVTAPSRHHIQYFEMFGNRALYDDGWVAAARHGLPEGFNADWNRQFKAGGYDKDRWELYHVTDDFSEADDLSVQYPKKLQALQALFDTEARKNDVYPLGGALSAEKPSLTSGQRVFVYYPGTQRIPQAVVPNFLQASYRITADVVAPSTGAQGLIAEYGDRVGGFALYVKDDHLVYETHAATRHEVMVSTVPIPSGKAKLAFEFVRNKSPIEGVWEQESIGTAHLFINGRVVGEMKPTHVLAEGVFRVGRAVGSPVTTAFSPPFEFNGTLEQVKVELN